MARVCHVLTGIPPGSRVNVRACGRFSQFNEVVRSGAIGITANREAYPIRVSISRVNLGNAKWAGGLNVVVPMTPTDGVELVEFGGPTGGDFDVTIKNGLDFNPSKVETYLPFDPRVGPWLDTNQVKAEETPETRVHNIYLCAGCNKDLGKPGSKYCLDCQVQVMTCEHPKIGSINPQECGSQLHPGYGACLAHLELMGIDLTRKRKIKTPKVKQIAAGRRPKRTSAETRKTKVEKRDIVLVID